MNSSEKLGDVYSHIIHSLDITSSGIQKRIEFLEIDENDSSKLKSLAKPVSQAHERLMNSFYGHLDRFDAIRVKIDTPDVRERLIEKQKAYLNELFSGNYDQEYFLKRLKVGIAHQQVGLNAQWYVGAYCKYICSLLPIIISELDNDKENIVASLRALLKVIFLDIGLVLETYFQADKQSIEGLKEYAESIVCSVPSGLVVLDKELKIVSANRQLDKLCKDHHSTLKGQYLTSVFLDLDIIERAKEVMVTGIPQSGLQVSHIGPLQSNGHYEITITPMYISPGKDEITNAASLLLIIDDITQQKKLRQATLDADTRARVIMEHIPDGIITVNEKSEVESINLAASEIFSYTSLEVVGKNVKTLIPNLFAEGYENYVLKYLSCGSIKTFGTGFLEVEGKRKDSSVFPLELSICEMELGNEKRFIIIVRDITERQKSEDKMRVLSRALEQTADVIMITNKQGIIEYVNHGFEEVTGYSRQEALNKKPSLLKSGKQKSDFYKQMWETINTGNVFREVLINQKKDGTLYYEEKTITPLTDKNGRITHFISSGKDITERMLTQEKLHYLAHHDILTDLPNRLLFTERLAFALERGKWSDRYVALLFLDVDRFKNINDTLGHHVGDILLKSIAKRLSSCIRNGDTVARISGDEFAILLKDIASLSDIPALIQHFLDELEMPFLVEDRELHVTTSIGAAVYPKDTLDPKELMKFADVAMYRAKAKGRNNYHLFTASMNSMTEDNLMLENQLRKALANNEFEIYYQPQVDIKTGKTVSMEALLRWNHPVRGLLYPCDFIGLLEETGLIVATGNWVIKAVCEQLNLWQENGINDLSISVNVAPRQLSDSNFFKVLIKNLKKNKVSPEKLHLEITESTLMDHEENTLKTIEDVCAHGVSLVMDDFGTGYSSLSYLRRFPISTLKIDKSFIADIPGDSDDCNLTRATISLGQIMSQKVVAEGVETQAQYKFLANHACDIAQGYHISKPMPHEEALLFLLESESC